MQDQLNQAVKLGNVKVDSIEYREMNTSVLAVKESIKDMEIEIENLIQQ